METSSDTMKRTAHRGFYGPAGALVALIILLGFGKTYYLKPAFGTPALPPLLHVHGLVMTLWFAQWLVR